MPESTVRLVCAHVDVEGVLCGHHPDRHLGGWCAACLVVSDGWPAGFAERAAHHDVEIGVACECFEGNVPDGGCPRCDGSGILPATA